MKYYRFHQNNSGGELRAPARVAFIQAPTAVDANERAIEHGIYFQGIEKGFDCPCCGSRWCKATENDAVSLDELPADIAQETGSILIIPNHETSNC